MWIPAASVPINELFNRCVRDNLNNRIGTVTRLTIKGDATFITVSWPWESIEYLHSHTVGDKVRVVLTPSIELLQEQVK